MASYLTDQHRHFSWCRSCLHRHFRHHYLTLLHLGHFVFSSDFLP
ncbi:hypothetical protein ACJIZ3_005847 [Penstemon smallii]|uniref:Uncharacterized protein n=1 Tax=Penstemon smallii TaxID=265156 RepID=A0ABD3S655_9LAMI